MWGKRRYSGYRRQRRGGCVAMAVWAGILLNVVLIAIGMSNGRDLSLLALFSPTADAGSAAVRAFNAGDLNGAVQQAEAALQSNPNDTTAAMTLTRALVYRSYVDFRYEDDLATALETAASVAVRNPTDPDALAAHAFALQANGQAAQAVEVAERALEIDPNHTLARTSQALGYARAGSYDTALRHSETAISNDANTPEVFDARRARAISLADLGRYLDAGEALDALIEDYSSVIPLRYERALYARQVSDPDTAENAYLRVLNLDAENAKARLRLCELTEGIGERESALQYCQQITEFAPTLPAGWYRLGRLHYLGGDFTQAQQTLNRCSSLQVMQNVPPQQRIFECWYLQGQAAEILGDCTALLTLYNQFQVMASDSAVRETWTYPPEGPPMCTGN